MSSLLPFSACSYSSYKEFLTDAYEYLHAKDETISYEKIAIACDLKTRTHAKNIIRGEQKPNSKQINALADFFQLPEAEKKYLDCLMKFNDPQNSNVASELIQQLMTIIKMEVKVDNNPFHDVQVMSSFLHLSILSIFEFAPNSTTNEIHKLLRERFDLTAINQAIQDLEKLKYIAYSKVSNTSNERVLLQKHIRQYDYNSNYFLKNFHNECLDMAKKTLNEDPTSERYLVGASFAINSKIFPRLIQKINAFIENAMKMGELAGEPDMVVQLNSQLLKITIVNNTEQKSVLGMNNAERELLN